MQRLLANYFVFDRFEDADCLAKIQSEILPNLTCLKASQNFTAQERGVLLKLAKKSRKRFAITSHLPKNEAIKTLRSLVEKDVIVIEKTHEERAENIPSRKPPRALRRHRVQDKFHFASNFLRFWFYFIEPNFNLSEEEIFAKIKFDFDNFCAGGFERACCHFLQLYLNLAEVSSFWDLKNEFDIYANEGGFCVVGEVKWRGRVVCKSVLSQLRFKCDQSGLLPEKLVLFSKNGFSQELLLEAKRRRDLLLFDADEVALLLKSSI